MSLMLRIPSQYSVQARRTSIQLLSFQVWLENLGDIMLAYNVVS